MKERLSALIDGELEPARFDQVLAQLHVDPALRNDWQDWHLVGDVMQQHPILSPGFMKTFSARLAAEPVVFAPAAAASQRRRFIRRALAPLSAAASVAFLSVVGWQAFHGAYTGSAVAAPQMAAVAHTQPVRVASSDRRFGAYLAAHQQDSGNPIDGRDLVYASFETRQPNP